jgi:polysaccharide export outer membrane protein
MIWKRWISVLGLLCIAAAWVGCETPGSKEPYVCTADEIRTGDKLSISLLDIPEVLQIHDKDFVVRGDGTVNLPQIGAVQAAGKKFAAFEQEVAKLYVEKDFYKKITVIVKAGERFYTVDGEVKGPDRKLYIGDTTVVRAIASCGGFTDFANRRKVKIIRANGQTEIVDCRKAAENPKYDRPICPGDLIIVPRSL